MLVAFGLGIDTRAFTWPRQDHRSSLYLVGSRGTFKHDSHFSPGGMVTFTHTISVFFLGLTTLFLSQYVLPEKDIPVLGAHLRPFHSLGSGG